METVERDLLDGRKIVFSAVGQAPHPDVTFQYMVFDSDGICYASGFSWQSPTKSFEMYQESVIKIYRR